MFVQPIVIRFIKLVLKLELNILYFFTMTQIGYLAYCYCAFAFVYGRPIAITGDVYEKYVWAIATWVVLDVLTMAFLFYIVLRFEAGRRLIYNLVPRDYVVSCIGNPGSRVLAKAGLVFFVAMSSDILFQSAQTSVNQQTVNTYVDSCSAAGVPANEQTIKEIILYRKDSNELGHVFVSTPATLAKSVFGPK
jgi:hypothetical protein